MNFRKLVRTETTSLVLIIIGIVIILTFLVPFLWNEFVFNTSSKINSDKFGQFGDFVGGFVGSIWSLAGVLLFYIALKDQRVDLRTNQDALNLQIHALNQQIEEFKFQRIELESTRKIFEEQSKTQRIQQFESNFYSLLNVYLTIKTNLNNLSDSKDYFKARFQELENGYDDNKSPASHHTEMIEKYINVFNQHSAQLSHYFKCFYRIVKIIDTNPALRDDEKLFYVKILRSQLTDFEQLLIYYNSFSILGEKARPLILKYSILKHNPIFNKPEFKVLQAMQNDNTLFLFSEWLSKFISTHLASSYELTFELDKVEENCPYINGIVGIYFSDVIDLKFYCKKDLRQNHINLTNDQFSNFIVRFLYDRLVFKSYVELGMVDLRPYRTETQDGMIFGVEIHTDIMFSLN